MQQLLDFPEHVEKTEPIRQKQMDTLAFDQDSETLEKQVRDLMQELEDIQEEVRGIWEFRRHYSNRDNLEALQEQKRRLTKWVKQNELPS
ncbi:hypothetical protein [Brevibacillus porteri]|uniref:Uncharacterized protein n=1 Tax=Brevibacillus porteri TaxID=2126350 RepID=A0ABX5FQK7_9BACL|nr:hypothetical protein [Brevibacillus porteri]MED1800649.1 hypothetical protein [Brevibacillus porteri]MED2134723.1 hypothetical protein [Brevibacillus porteri]MED2745620.1 hypothetical protein [Brevibacillus porteri]MED2814742.1 hypothetical protein [Brevibacillus porteri]MED2896316.1 hypothetical protein [Brevibacillus porteri]